MKIVGGKLSRILLHTHEPFKIAFEVLDECHGVLLELQTDEGLFGLGESSPARRITGETSEGAVSVLQSVLLPAIRGMNPFEIEAIHEAMDDAIQGNPSAKAAVDLACYDLLGKVSRLPVVSLLGGERKPLPCDHTIGIKPPEDQARIAADLVKKGFKFLKVKLGHGWEEDVARVRAVRQQVGKGIGIRVDANQGWTVREAIRVLEKIELFDIELAEQPIPAHDLQGLRWLRERSPIPVAADESVHGPRDALRAVEMGACDIVNIKLMKCGGIYRALEVAAIVKAAGLACMIGGMIGESRLAVGAAAHFAASRSVVRYFDLDADLLLRDDLVEKGGIGLEAGNRTLPDLPGLGVEKMRAGFLTEV